MVSPLEIVFEIAHGVEYPHRPCALESLPLVVRPLASSGQQSQALSLELFSVHRSCVEVRAGIPPDSDIVPQLWHRWEWLPLACSQHLPEAVTKLTDLVSTAERGRRRAIRLVPC